MKYWVYVSKAIVLLFAIAGLSTQRFPLPDLNSSLVEGFLSEKRLVITPARKCLPWLSLKDERSTSEVHFPMKIKFRQSGGYAGLMLGSEIDTDSLSADEAAKLQSLVEESGILQAKGGRTPNARDLLNYEITIETSKGVHKVVFDEMSLPEKAFPLVEYLQDQAKPVR